MPTLAGDKQMVLADGKVLFQGQEVAFVVAEDRYIAADAVELVEVDYEELPVVVDPFKALADDAPVLREDLAGKTEGAHGPRRHHNHIFTWEQGDKDATEAVLAEPMWWPRRWSTTTAPIPARWKPAAASPRWTRSTAS
jgi:carbon-monoxide dehydrogenase large subunit